MDRRIDQVKSALQPPSARVAGRVVAEDKETMQVRMGGYLLDIPKASILAKEDDPGDVVILTLKPETELVMSTVTPVEHMIGALSSRILKGMVRADTECCDCECTECSYCSDCTECSYCADARLASRVAGLGRIGRFGARR